MPKQLLHMSELLVTKMLDMPISEMKKFLKETLLESTTSTNRKEGEALLQSLEGLLENADGDIQIPNGDKSILETATVKGLQEALDTDGNLDENYLKDLKDVSDLKLIGDEMGWDFSDLTVERFHDILEEPLILERMVKDEDKKEQKSLEKEGATGNFGRKDSDKHKPDAIVKKREINLLRERKFSKDSKLKQAADAHFQLGYLLHREGHLKSAIEEYELCLQKDSGHPSALHMLAAAKGEPVKKATKSYVVDLFDYYAPNYDKHMVGTLEFKTPFLIHSAVREVLESSDGDRVRPKNMNETEMTILDLGCGTGLCGSLFASPKHTLIGVDLSSSMANRARARNVYKNVIVADVLDFAKFVVPSSKIDIVLLSDVLGYIGDVSGFFEDLSLSLREQGMIALTIEVLHQGKVAQSGSSAKPTNPSGTELFCGENGKQYSLDAMHGRFRHCKQYILNSLVAAGLNIVYSENVELRLQHRKGVKGQLIIGRKL
eukprot:g4031.t1